MTFLATAIRNAAPLVARRAALKQTPVALSAIAQKRWNSNSVEVNFVVDLPARGNPPVFPSFTLMCLPINSR
jgi:hypothetical protein